MKDTYCGVLLAVACFVGTSPAWALDDADDEAVAAREKAAREKAEADKKAAKDATKENSKKPPANDKPAAGNKKDDKNPFANPEAGPPAPTNPVNPPAANKDALPAGANAADALCPLCKGTGFLPNSPYKPYMKFEGQPPPNPDFVPAYKYCDKCQKGQDAKTISDDMKTRQQGAVDKHLMYEENTGKKLAQFETPFVTVRSVLAPGVNKTVASKLELCADKLQGLTKTLVLLPTRPDTDDIILMNDEKTYHTYIDKVFPNNEHIDLMKKTSGTETQHVAALKMTSPGAPPESRAVFSFGGLLMRNATNMKAKPWLVEGFSAFCENLTLNSNLNYRIAYEFKEVKLNTKSWNEDIKKSAGKLKTWPEIFELNLEGMKPLDYELCYSVVSYLVKTDPAKFDKMVLNVDSGDESDAAIEKAYGKKIKDLQADWGKWIMTQK